MSNNTIWITGSKGRMGSALIKMLKNELDAKIIGTDKEVDITDADAVNQAVDMYRPNIIINCASISDSEYCESHEVEAYKVNALGARNIATASRHVNAKIIHISTDDVFDAKKEGSFNEFEIPEARSVYGKSKIAGENFVRELNPKHLIIRSSWVYGLGQGDYLSYVIDKAKKSESFEAAVNQISSPTSAIELARFAVKILETSEYGIYHVSGTGACSRYEFARTILERMGYDTNLVKEKYIGSDKEKVSTLLDNLMLKMTRIYETDSWQNELDEYIKLAKEGM